MILRALDIAVQTPPVDLLAQHQQHVQQLQQQDARRHHHRRNRSVASSFAAGGSPTAAQNRPLGGAAARRYSVASEASSIPLQTLRSPKGRAGNGVGVGAGADYDDNSDHDSEYADEVKTNVEDNAVLDIYAFLNPSLIVSQGAHFDTISRHDSYGTVTFRSVVYALFRRVVGVSMPDWLPAEKDGTFAGSSTDVLASEWIVVGSP